MCGCGLSLNGHLLSTQCVSDPEVSSGGSAMKTDSVNPHKADSLGGVNKSKQVN